MSKRPFVVADDEEPIILIPPTTAELDEDTKRLMRKFAKYGKQYPRLLSALRATVESDE